MERSRQLAKLRGVKKALLWPYVGLIVAVRLTSVGRAPLLSLLPSRIIRRATHAESGVTHCPLRLHAHAACQASAI